MTEGALHFSVKCRINLQKVDGSNKMSRDKEKEILEFTGWTNSSCFWAVWAGAEHKTVDHGVHMAS